MAAKKSKNGKKREKNIRTKFHKKSNNVQNMKKVERQKTSVPAISTSVLVKI